MSVLMLYVANWFLLSLCGSLYVLLLRTVSRPNYERLKIFFPFRPLYLLVAGAGIVVLIYRECLAISFQETVGYLPGSYYWEQALYWSYQIHLVSLLMYSGLLLYLWSRYDSLFLSGIVTLFALATLEFTFIPQQWLAWRVFLGAWYLPFLAFSTLFVVERDSFTITRKRAMVLWIVSALVLEYGLVPFSGLSLVDLSSSPVLNQKVLPHPGLGTWIFMEANHVLKLCFLKGFSLIELRRPLP